VLTKRQILYELQDVINQSIIFFTITYLGESTQHAPKIHGKVSYPGALRTQHPAIYSVRIHNIQHLKQPIREAAASVTADVLGRGWQEMEYRLDVRRAIYGSILELRNACRKNYLSCSLI
jgi:hypothetical protein